MIQKKLALKELGRTLQYDCYYLTEDNKSLKIIKLLGQQLEQNGQVDIEILRKLWRNSNEEN